MDDRNMKTGELPEKNMSLKAFSENLSSGLEKKLESAPAASI
ncbi:hypothetical protein Pan110_11900 [Gimesia panareensis]|nr:hypothetical protein Pan110_11900 [Gimesia panareensis]